MLISQLFFPVSSKLCLKWQNLAQKPSFRFFLLQMLAPLWLDHVILNSLWWFAKLTRHSLLRKKQISFCHKTWTLTKLISRVFTTNECLLQILFYLFQNDLCLFLPMNFSSVTCNMPCGDVNVCIRQVFDWVLVECFFFFSVSAVQKEHHSREKPSIVVAAKEEWQKHSQSSHSDIITAGSIAQNSD